MKDSAYTRCSINELKAKEVINIHDGARLGNINDVEIDLESGRLISITLPGTYRLMGFLGRENDIVIHWDDIKKIGDDVIIIDSKE